ncbi:YdcH family protein [Sandaracinobacter sp. RS1-74]|uniref:YdcH family protein n=1 Tax=Sandaracinobacteroides sayramensis TaxID=2913411 RepID=UPI001EDC6D2C|nr:YdcH family protein [Sandaracinobacteroides sayramensis]MCG2840464.1 YdcH family protein [Sandaracinobacteroides sayramensis]
MASAHLEALNARHALLDGKIAAEMSRPVPDSATIGQLKRQKLKVKEEIQRGA